MAIQTKKSSQHIYDYAIIGSGLSGLCIANALSKISSNTILIEAADSFGGFNHSITTPVGPMNNGLRFLPDNESSHKAIAFLEMLLLTSLSPRSEEIPAVTFEAGGLKPFLGFGDNPPAFYSDLSYFSANSRLKTHLEPHEWTQILFNNYTGDFSPKSFVTKFNVENEQVVSVTINGQKKIQALNFIYAGPVKALAQLLPEESLSSKAKGKLAKNNYWTAVCMDLLHTGTVTESQAVHILNGTTQDELGPCVGLFMPSSTIDEKVLQYSQWLTFVDSEEAEDTEVVGAALKKMKRQIKRVYPDALENISYERIVVASDYSGNGDLKINSNQSLPNLKNLWLGSGTLSKQKNIIGSLFQAELVTSALSCHPLGQSTEAVAIERNDAEFSEII